MLKVILYCMNLYNLPKGICAVLLGCAAASYLGTFELIPATLAFIFVIFIQITVNLQTVYSELHNYSGKVLDLSFTGRPIVLGKDMELPLKMCMMMFGILSTTSGLGLATIGGWPALLVGALLFGIVVYYRYSHTSVRFTFYAPLIVFFFYGPIGVFGTYLLQAFNYSDYVFQWNDFYIPSLLSIVSGLYACNIWVLGERMRNVLLPPDMRKFFTGKHSGVLKRLFITNTIVIFLLQVYICSRAMENTISILSYGAPVACFAINLWIWQRAKKVAAGRGMEYRRLMFWCMGGMILYAVCTLVWLITVNLRPDLTPTVFF